MRVVFLGNHNVGLEALQSIGERAEIVGVVAHPPDPEDGVRYASVHDYAQGQGWNVRRISGKSPELPRWIRECRPELIWVTDYRYLLRADVLSLAPLGAVNLHPSLLPKYRGRASINWAILHGETTLGLTAHFIDEGMDTGDIIEQIPFELAEDQDVGDALRILYPFYRTLTARVIDAFLAGPVAGRPQDHREATAFPRRTPEEGRIDWERPANQVRNLIRAVAHPYPGAFSTLDGRTLTAWKASIADLDSMAAASGTILEVRPEGVVVQCRPGSILLTRYDLDAAGDSSVLAPGAVLEGRAR